MQAGHGNYNGFSTEEYTLLVIVIYMLIFFVLRTQQYGLEKDKIGGQLFLVINNKREPDV